MDVSKAPSNLPDPKDRRETEAWLDRRSEKLGDAIARSLKKVVTSSYERFLATLPETSIISSLTAAGDFHAFDSIVGDWKLIYEKEIAPEIEETYLSGAMSAFTQAPDADKMSDDEVSSWARVTNDQAMTYMTSASNRLAGVGDTIWNDVRDRVSSAVASGMSNEELKDQIGKLSDFSEYRADTIARTETIGAYVNGDWQGAQLLGEFGPVEKVWVATGDARGREWHTDMMSESIPVDEPFDVDGEPMMYPHDPSGSAFNVVNCRCYVEFLYVGDTRPDGSVITAQEATADEEGQYLEEIAVEETVTEVPPVDFDALSNLERELEIALDRAEEPVSRFIETQKEVYSTGFDRKGQRYQEQVRKQYGREYSVAKAEADKANDLATQVMDLRFRPFEALDDTGSRWRGVSIDQRAVIKGAPPEDAKFKRFRDKYVVADTPTLEMNSALRGDIPLTPALKTRVTEAKYLTEGVLETDAVLSRTMALPMDTVLDLKPGAIFESAGYQSTQTGYVSSYGRQLENPGSIHTEFLIRTPAGTHAGDVGFGEIVLRPGKMRVISTEWDPKVTRSVGDGTRTELRPTFRVVVELLEETPIPAGSTAPKPKVPASLKKQHVDSKKFTPAEEVKAHDFATGQQGQTFQFLDSEDVNAVINYQAEMVYTEINEGLRAGLIPAEWAKTVSTLDDLLEISGFSEDIIVYRGIELPTGGASALSPGTKISDLGFQSTSLNPFVAENFSVGRGLTTDPMDSVVLEILVPQGSQALAADVAVETALKSSSYQFDEMIGFGRLNEVILPRGSEYTVIDSRVEDGINYVRVILTKVDTVALP